MKILKNFPTWAVVIILLLLANLGFIGRNLFQHSGLFAAGKQFKIEMLNTNNMSGIGIFEAKTEQPLWAEFSQDGKLLTENYFFHGKDVFDITFSTNRPPKYTVYFRGPGKSVTWWLDRLGSGAFTERIFYNTNGDFSRHEVWYNQTWFPVNRRNEKNGIVIKGEWHPLAFDTNGLWTIEAP